jgi:2',3'-cyclic-nucleotide 2'-phosphodiesterase
LRIIFIGDIVGSPGRQAVAHVLPKLKEEFSPDLIIANGENAAGGTGITQDVAREIFGNGVDVITLGNHAWAKKDIYPYLDDEPRIVRPANYPNGVPGRGWAICHADAGVPVAVVNLCGRVFMDHLDNPFRAIDQILEKLRNQAGIVLVDFHAEATSEKVAFGWYVDGRVSAVIGTHTHVQTADEQVLPDGTAYITDVGMTGPVDSVIGVKKDIIISRFLTHMPNKFEIADGRTLLSAVMMDIDSDNGRAIAIHRLRRNGTASD